MEEKTNDNAKFTTNWTSIPDNQYTRKIPNSAKLMAVCFYVLIYALLMAKNFHLDQRKKTYEKSKLYSIGGKKHCSYKMVNFVKKMLVRTDLRCIRSQVFCPLEHFDTIL